MKSRPRRRRVPKKQHLLNEQASLDEQEDVETEYVSAPILPLENDLALAEEFAGVLAKFKVPTGNEEGDVEEGGLDWQYQNHEEAPLGGQSDDYNLEYFGDDDDGENTLKLSKKKLRKLNRMSLADLKQWAPHPEVVEWEDVTASDPKLLVAIKCSRHTVQVPHHWSHKRKYLSGKRGYVKPSFELPSFIRDTGITELRETMRAEDAAKRIKVKAREKMHPKLGRISVDYEKLYDAFFKYQTKPPLTGFGELYYEGKEVQDRKKEVRSGYLSEELRTALGMTSVIMPPPWLLAMQKHGMPPSYPNSKIAGLNAPIPEGAQWGYHPGGWGKPIVDDFLRDLPNKVEDERIARLLVSIERNLWGELEPDEEYGEGDSDGDGGNQDIVIEGEIEEAEDDKIPTHTESIDYKVETAR